MRDAVDEQTTREAMGKGYYLWDVAKHQEIWLISGHEQAFYSLEDALVVKESMATKSASLN